MTKTETVAALRAWAEGSYDVEAAVELLVRAFDGALTEGPWIVHDDGWARFDASQTTEAGHLSVGQRRVLAIAASLADADQRVALSDVLPGLDRDAAALVLAAIAHAAGTHEHADVEVIDGVMTGHGPLPSLYPWPAATPSPRPMRNERDADS